MGLEGAVEEVDKNTGKQAVHLGVAHVSTDRVQVHLHHLEAGLRVLEEWVQVEQ